MILTLTSQSPADVQPLRLDRRTAVLGRMPDADMVLPVSAVSSRHCRIDWHDGGYVLTDTSSNGTRLNGQALTIPARLTDGDLIEIGPYVIAAALTAIAGELLPRQPSRMVLDSWNRSAGSTQSPGQSQPPGVPVPEAAVRSSSPPLPSDADATTRLLYQLTAGAMTLLAARSQARSELGILAAATTNPLFGSASVPAVLTQLLSHPAAAERAVAEGFADLDAHQRATLRAMQGALRATLDSLAPDAIRKRTGKSDPATLWRAYEQAFTGVGGDASFIEVFARELEAAYRQLSELRSR